MTSPSDARRAGIIGMGLIGGSIGFALRQAGWFVTGTDVDEGTAGRALALGAVDALGVDAGASVTFVATPVGAVAGVARELLRATRGAVTDVGGVKAGVVAAVDDPRFVGGHPMAGSELAGVEGADADLFRNAAWVLTPTARTDPDAFAMVLAAVAAMGAEVVAVDPEQHDAIVAVVSHVPHLTAASLMAIADGHAREYEAPLLRLAAGGFRDMTRIAAGATGIWPDVCAENAAAITAVLDELVAELARVREIVAGQRRDDLVALLETSRAARLALPGRTARPAGEVVELRVPVPNREGVLADVTTLATSLGVNIEALETADATEHERGLIVMVVAAEAGHRLRDALVARGYRPVVQAIG
ncbi:MAG TPA: prephenate dehydrogenase/arogenate dehydrogenase family protein [Acidimicrobiales bacterium]|nr:prephenate dehydrogenase/arogenate dehydrogenase family protein [Acidimicrobiales bacterium]